MIDVMVHACFMQLIQKRWFCSSSQSIRMLACSCSRISCYNVCTCLLAVVLFPVFVSLSLKAAFLYWHSTLILGRSVQVSHHEFSALRSSWSSAWWILTSPAPCGTPERTGSFHGRGPPFSCSFPICHSLNSSLSWGTVLKASMMTVWVHG